MIDDDRPTILFMGVGDLTVRVAQMLSTTNAGLDIVMGSRSLDRAVRHANLIGFGARNMGLFPTVSGRQVDLSDLERTAELIADLRPALIFMGASIQAARRTMDLSPDLFVTIDRAQLGPWLAVHLALNLELMQSLRMSGVNAKVVNACYPDAVGPVLSKVGLAPDIGVGNVGNIVPAIRAAAALLSGEPECSLHVQLVAHHYFSHHVHRYGEARGIPHDLHLTNASTTLNLDQDELYSLLARGLRRQGGRSGQHITATSALRVVQALQSPVPVPVHAPAPGGLVGGYPALVGHDSIDVDLRPGMPLAEAVAINTRCQRLDGIEHINQDGSVDFTAEHAQILLDTLGYAVPTLQLNECRQVAVEMNARFDQLQGVR